MTTFFYSYFSCLLITCSAIFICSELQLGALVLGLLVLLGIGLACMFENVSTQKIILSLVASFIITALGAALWYYGGNVTESSLFFTALPFLCQLVLIVLDLVTPQTETPPSDTQTNTKQNCHITNKGE